MNPYKPGSRRWADVERLGLAQALERSQARESRYRERIKQTAIINDVRIAEARAIRRSVRERARSELRAQKREYIDSREGLYQRAIQRAYALNVYQRGEGWAIENPFERFAASIRNGASVTVETAPGKFERINIRSMVLAAEREGYKRRVGSAYHKLLMFAGVQLQYDEQGKFKMQTPRNMILPFKQGKRRK